MGVVRFIFYFLIWFFLVCDSSSAEIEHAAPDAAQCEARHGTGQGEKY